ncbi:CidA/LrgA family protein [Salibacterium halotolerans]|uniref:Holin-like protein n=1 Tax=Salibacterium halotolerans TaxID=1884432 RepID=A0A1I5R585_9BACI|nr:CidA/LrgA family protein [Salibacterium halotolerans]SFP53692.1 holin-like protein [Salibacterium halotolerans]
MQTIRIVFHIAILFLFYYTGVWIQEAFQLMIPGSIIGMLLLLGCFSLNIVKPAWLEQGTSLLLSHMPLLFLPVTAGIIAHTSLFAGEGLWLVVIAYISTLLVLVTSGWTVQLLLKRGTRDE